MSNQQVKSSGYSGPERRKNLPTMELWQENIRALSQCQVTGCQMRYALTPQELTFLFRFENQIPMGRINFLFPSIERESVVSECWQTFVLTLGISDEGKMSVEIRGFYNRDGVPLDVRVQFVRDLGVGVGIVEDSVSYTDRRDGSTHSSTLAEIISTKLKSGDPKYSRKDDDVKNISVEGMVAVLCRYMKVSAVRRRVLPKPVNNDDLSSLPPPPAN